MLVGSFTLRDAYLLRKTASTHAVRLLYMRSGWLIREARLRAGLTQTELAERTGRDRAVIARWEQEVVAPSMETLVDLVRACGFDLPLVLVPYDTGRDERLESNLNRSPERRLEQLLSTLSSSGRKRG